MHSCIMHARVPSVSQASNPFAVRSYAVYSGLQRETIDKNLNETFYI